MSSHLKKPSLSRRLVIAALTSAAMAATALSPITPSLGQSVTSSPAAQIPATANITWNVSTAAALEAALSAAANYNWNSLYFPTFNLGTSASLGNIAISLPWLVNCPAGGVIVGNNTTPTNVTAGDTGSAYSFAIQQYSTWTISGISFTGSYGGILINPFGTLGIIGAGATLDFSGTFSKFGICNSQGFISAFGCTLTVHSTSLTSLIGCFGLTDFDHGTIVFENAITFSGPVISLDSRYAFLGFVAGAFTNGSNVTVSSGQCLVMTNGAYFETGGSATVDGVTLTRANFPGHSAGFLIDFNSIFQPDNGFIVASNVILGWTNNSANTGTLDTGLSRYSAGIVVIGNGTPGDFSGSIGAAGIFCTSSTGTFGYAQGLGVGGTVTQATSKSTGVTLNTACGQITMNNAALTAATIVSFVLTDSAFVAGDLVILNHVSGGTLGAYSLNASCANGSVTIYVRNNTSGSLSEAIVIGFAKFGAGTT
jgi:hypothetical protein